MMIGASDMIENVTNRIAQPADGLVVDVTSDLICPWCFVAKRRLEKASSIFGKTLEIRWHPFHSTLRCLSKVSTGALTESFIEYRRQPAKEPISPLQVRSFATILTDFNSRIGRIGWHIFGEARQYDERGAGGRQRERNRPAVASRLVYYKTRDRWSDQRTECVARIERADERAESSGAKQMRHNGGGKCE